MRTFGPEASKTNVRPAIEPRGSPVADIALLLEGTYPYIRGGVSSWVHQIISGLPEIRFAVIFIGGTEGMYGPAQYQLPPNVTHVETHYLLHRDKRHLKPSARQGNRRAFEAMGALHAYMREDGKISDEQMVRAQLVSAQTTKAQAGAAQLANTFASLGSAEGISQE